MRPELNEKFKKALSLVKEVQQEVDDWELKNFIPLDDTSHKEVKEGEGNAFVVVTPSGEMLVHTIAMTPRLCKIEACVYYSISKNFEEGFEARGYIVVPVNIKSVCKWCGGTGQISEPQYKDSKRYAVRCPNCNSAHLKSLLK